MDHQASRTTAHLALSRRPALATRSMQRGAWPFWRYAYAGVPNTEIHLYAKGRHGQPPRGAPAAGRYVGAWTDRLVECESFGLLLRPIDQQGTID